MHQSVKIFIVCVVICVVKSITSSVIYSNDVEPKYGDYFGNNIDLLNFPLFWFKSSKMNVEKVDGIIRYTFGKRVKNDRLVSQNTDKSYWPSPQNVTLILQYPGSGQRKVSFLTFVEVIVNQSSNIGTARVLAGGIGANYIACIFEANRTYWFNYAANIYGI